MPSRQPTPHPITLIAALLFAGAVAAAPTQLANTPLSGASAADISPNVLFVLDDSGSMDWEYLPDWAYSTDIARSRNSSFNGLAYNPAFTYLPPKYFDASGQVDTSTYPTQSTWTSVPDDGYGRQSTSRSNLVGEAYYFSTVAGEYCTDERLKVCNAQSAASTQYPVAARLRWCKTAADATALVPPAGACQATMIEPTTDANGNLTNIPFDRARMPSPRVSTLTISGSGSTSVSSITVNNLNILDASTVTTSTRSTLASDIADKINACTTSLARTAPNITQCQTLGYRAAASGSTVTIFAPGVTTATPVVTRSGTMTISPTAFDRPATNLAPGENLLVVIDSSVTQAARALTRTDCAADPCTHAEEMTNFANWWAYYRSRMQAMKTSASLAFQPVSSSFRVGYMSINNNTGSDFQNISGFSAAQKKAWYDKLFAARPSGYTPLRRALARAGRLYAGRLTTLNGVSVVDPVQFYCQANVTILSSDGYWNSSAGFRWDGTTAVGDQDGPGLETRPQLDGGGYNAEKTTRQITETLTPTQPIQAETQTGQLQQRTSQLERLDSVWTQATQYLQISTLDQLQTRTVQSYQRSEFPLETRTTVEQENVSDLQFRDVLRIEKRTADLQASVSQVQTRTSSNSGRTWTVWSNVDSCIEDRSGSNRRECQKLAASTPRVVTSCRVNNRPDSSVNGSDGLPVWTLYTNTACSYAAWSAWGWDPANPACSARAQGPGPTDFTGPATECQPIWDTWTNVPTGGSCTPQTNQRECQYSAWSGWRTSTSTPCTTQAQNFTNLRARQCQTVWTGWEPTTQTTQPTTPPGNCTPQTNQTECRYAPQPSRVDTVASCASLPRSTASPFNNPAVDCTPNYGTWSNQTGPCPSTNTQTTQCAWRAPVTTSSCVAPPGGVPYQCSYSAPVTDPTPLATCTSVPADWLNFSVPVATGCTQSFPNGINFQPATTCSLAPNQYCRYTAWTGWSDLSASSCAAEPRSNGPSYNHPDPAAPGLARECQTLIQNPNWQTVVPPTTSCTAGQTISASGVVTNTRCVIPPASSRLVASCVPEVASAANNWIERTCHTVTTGPTVVTSCVPEAATAANNFVETTCAQISLGPTSDTLADVAQYYWKTDLRDPSQTPDRCTGGPVTVGNVTVNNNVCTNDTRYPRQFMSTYTLGLGASGLMQYRKDYETATSGDFHSVKIGEPVDQTAGICSWQTIGPCNWPKPYSDAQANIDDLWHAAVNGRGIYYSATDPASLASGLSGALTAVSARAGALAAVTVSNPNLVAGANNEIFEVSFRVGEWSGDVVKRTIDPSSGVIAPTPVWSGQANIDALVSTSGHQARTIHTYNPPAQGAGCPGASANNLKPFLWAQLCTAEQAYFTPAINSLSQFCSFGANCLSAATQALASGENLVNFLRGDRSNEGPLANLATYYRERVHLLGDIVGSEAVYVKAPPWNYADYNYDTFRAANQSRAAMVYVAANDGMLHAFDVATGNELWAYVPSLVLSRMHKLADKNYAAQGMHQFTADGTPVFGDICASDCTRPTSGNLPTVWKTILVGGLNNGGRGYYALDITDPANPKALWEFTDSNLGYTYGNPVITKLKDGTWVVLVSSGYNNIGPGDGGGHLYVLNANTGALIRTIPTGVGDTTTPGGLARIVAWAQFPDSNNTALRVYGGDQLGNVWRFDINGDIPAPAVPPASPVYDAQRLATLRDPSGVAQPITARPEIAYVDNYPVVYVATGQLLGANDLATTQTQSVYAIKDRLLDVDYGNPRTATGNDDFVEQTLAAAACPTGNAYCTAGDAIFTITSNAMDWSVKGGAFVDLTIAGERVATDLRLQAGTLAFTSNQPTQNDPCVPGGKSILYAVDYRKLGPVSGTGGLAGIRLGSYLASSPSIIRLVDGRIRALIRTDAPGTVAAPVPAAPTPQDTRRVSWRELVTE